MQENADTPKMGEKAGRDITVSVDRRRGVAEFTFQERVHEASFVTAFESFRKEPRNFHFYGFVWDVRAADLSDVNFETLRAILPRNTLALPGMRSAAVIKDGPEKALGDLWRGVGTLVDTVERRVFLNIEEARDWVAEPREGGLPPDSDVG